MMCGTNNPHQERFNLVNANTPRTFHFSHLCTCNILQKQSQINNKLNKCAFPKPVSWILELARSQLCYICRYQAEPLWGVGVLHVRNYSTQALQIWPLNVQKIFVVHFSTTVCFSNDSVHTAPLARDEMFKVTWVQMSQSVGECLKRLSHCIPFLQAQFHQYQRGGGVYISELF